MLYLVCIKQVPGSSDVEIDEATGRLKRSEVPARLNPFDLFALKTAFELKQRYGGEVHVLSMGPPNAKDILVDALCMGANKAFLLSDRRFAGADVYATAYALSGCIKATKNDYSVILCGKQTTDGDTAQVGPEVAEMLGIPHASNVKRVDDVAQDITVLLDLEQSEQLQSMDIPCLLTIEKEPVPPKIARVRKKAEIAEDEIVVYSLDDLDDKDESHYGLAASPTQVQGIYAPEKCVQNQIFEGDTDVLAGDIHRLIKKYV